jgi:hypothetical protein
MQKQGFNESERYLAKLYQNTFLSFWSFLNLFRQPGQELCGLLVVCGDDTIILSDKFCEYPNTGKSVGIKLYQIVCENFGSCHEW